jgi:hypothetical protein
MRLPRVDLNSDDVSDNMANDEATDVTPLPRAVQLRRVPLVLVVLNVLSGKVAAPLHVGTKTFISVLKNVRLAWVQPQGMHVVNIDQTHQPLQSDQVQFATHK